MPLCMMNNGIGAELTMLVDEGVISSAVCNVQTAVA